MSKKINSEMMKRAVSVLFDHEVARNERVSSHSQLERWIIEELKVYTPRDSALALQKIMYETRGIEFDIDPKINIDDEVQSLEEYYSAKGFSLYDTGGNCVAFRVECYGDYYALVTEQSGAEIPTSIFEAVEFGLYNEGHELIFSEKFRTSIDLFQNKHINFII